MKNIIKRIIVGVIIGLVLMACRKYLFLNASAATLTTPTFDTFRFRYNNGTFLQTGFNGQNSDLTSSNLGSTNSGNLEYFLHFPSNISLVSGNVVYFSIGTSIYYDDINTLFNSTFSSSTNGSLVMGNDNFPCEVSSLITDSDPLVVGSGTTATIEPQLRIVHTYKCFIDSAATLTTGTNEVQVIGPNLQYQYGPWSYYSRGVSNWTIYSSPEYSIIQSQEATTNAINETNDTLKDDSIGIETDDDISNLQNTDISSTEDAGIQDLITLPIELFNGILSALNGSCTPYRIGTLLGEDIILPCFNLGGVLGSVWNIIDIVISSCIFFKFATKLKEIFINLTSLNENKGDLIE